MPEILSSLTKAFSLIFSGNEELWKILFLTLQTSLSAVLVAATIAVPIGTYLGLKKFRGKPLLINVVYTLMGLPPVLVGLVVFLLLSRSGPLGSLSLLFTPTAMVIAQVVLAIPIITGLTISAIIDKEKSIRELAFTLGATDSQIFWTLIKEARGQIMVAIITGFGRLVAEVGAVMMVGGNILGETRVLTTAIVLETRKGNMEFALALGIVLLALSFIVIVSVGLLRGIKFDV